MKRVALHCSVFLCVLLGFAARSFAQNSNSATFLHSDGTTKGAWIATYGANGYAIAEGRSFLPDLSKLGIAYGGFWVWANPTTDPRALQGPGGGSAIAQTLYDTQTLSVDVTVKPGIVEQIALYAVDWDFLGRSEIFQALDGDTNVPLGSQTLSNFTGGVYLIWNISGHVRITITSQAGPNAVLSGILFDPVQNTIHVPGDEPTIQAGINAANAGQIVLVAPGTYFENIDFLGKAVTVTSAAGPQTTIIDGSSKGAVATFDHNEGTGSVLNGFTLQNGLAYIAGGRIQILDSSPTITGNVITQNRAAIGLGIYVNDGSPVIQHNTITGNNVQYGDGGEGGGGILLTADNTATSTPQILGNTITNNGLPREATGAVSLFSISAIPRFRTI